MLVRLIILCFLIPAASACAFYYVDSHGATHVYGVGHLAMKALAPQEETKAVLEEMTLYGVAAGVREGQPSLSVGFENLQRMVIVDEDTAVRIDWPDASFFGIRVGSNPVRPLDESDGSGVEGGDEE